MLIKNKNRSKSAESLRRKAKGPVKWQPVATFLSIVWIDSAFFQLDKQVMIKKLIEYQEKETATV